MTDSLQTSRDPLARLIHDAGRREAPPAEMYQRALRAATEVWQAKVRLRRSRNLVVLAACFVALAVGAALLVGSFDAPPATSTPIAHVDRVVGDVRFRPAPSEPWRSLHEERTALQVAAVVRTEPASALALRFGEVSVRIAGGSEVVLESPSRLQLNSGRVYIDTGAREGVSQLLVITEIASVADVGTQFEVLYQYGRYRVRVREGHVLLHHGEQRERRSAGDQVSIDPGGRVSIGSIAADDPEWRWVQSLTSAPDIDDQPLTVLLAWVARETGLAVRYATPAIERKATATVLHGSIRNLEPLEALGVMLATTDMRHELLADGTIMIK